MKRVVCIGECMMELSHVDARTLRLGFAGDTYNTAVYLRRAASELRLDVEVGYLTGLGADRYSDSMRAEWRDESIVDRSITVHGRLPGLYAIHTDDSGERHFEYWREQSAARELFARADTFRDLDADVVHLSGITLQLLSRSALAALFERLQVLRRNGAWMSVDTNYRARGWSSPAEAAAAIDGACALADVVLASSDDERQLHGERSPRETIARLSSLGAREVIVRDGAYGAYLGAEGGVMRIPALAVEHVVDTTAAGDAFAGGYLAGRLAGREPESAAALGNAMAAAVIQHPGAITPRGLQLVSEPLPAGQPTAPTDKSRGE
jgi:2-dehydro-3-deoxygluconokinase